MQRLRRSWLTAVLVGNSVLTLACSNSPGKEAAPTQTSHEHPVSLAPGPDGTPLPPRNPDAARNWPPEFRRFVDEALVLFQPRTREPTPQEFETKLGIKLLPSNWKKTDHDGRMQVYRVEAPWIYRVKATDPPFWADLSTLSELPRPFTSSPDAGLRVYMLEFRMSPEMPVCINPYDLAIYTGANFTNSDHSPHQLPRTIWASAYEWGMFKRGYYGRYTSNKGFTISVDVSNSRRSVQQDATCVTGFWISTRFKPE